MARNNPRRRVGTAQPATTSRRPAAPQASAAALERATTVGSVRSLAGSGGSLLTDAVQNTLAINPLTGVRRRDVASGAGSLLKAVATSPVRATVQYRKYVKELGRVVQGESGLAPDAKDRRFADPAWKTNLFYRRLMQSYLATQQELAACIDGTTLNPREKGQAQFFASLLTDALAPSNWLLGNPAAVRKILDTGGTHLVDGLKNLVHDARHNRMMPSQVDATPFKVGVNLATSPGQVVLRHELFELLQYAPTTPQVHRRPLVMSPPQVNKYYAVDLSPDKSLA